MITERKMNEEQKNQMPKLNRKKPDYSLGSDKLAY